MATIERVQWDKINLDEWIAIIMANDNLKQINQRLTEQKVLLARAGDANPGLRSQLGDYDNRGVQERTKQRLESIGSQLSLENFVDSSKLFLLGE